LDSSDQNFINDLEALGPKLQQQDEINDYESGYVLENDRIISLGFYYLSDVEALPESIGNLKNLRELFISYCYSLTSLPDSIGDLFSLESLTIVYCNSIASLPETIGNLKNLKKLKIQRSGGLTNLPENLGDLEKLEEISLNNCRSIMELPESIGNLKNLKKLKIYSVGSMETLPKNLKNLQALETLELNSIKKLKSLPMNIGELKSLQKLIINGCYQLENLPESIGNLVNLKELKISNTDKLKRLPESFFNLKSLENLNIDHCKALISLSNSFGEINSLKTLKISNCGALEKFPDSIGKLNNLTLFEINHCGALKSLPEYVSDLVNLEEFKILGCSSLKSLPESFKILSNLKKLEIRKCNNFSNLSKEIGELNPLEELIIHDCPNLKNLPKSIWDLKNLTKLELVKCKNLELWPKEIISLKSLKNLTIKECSFKQLPEELTTLKTLESFDLSNNFFSPKAEIKFSLIPKRWKKDYEPWRKLIVWGRDNHGNPSFIILFGRHKFMGIKLNITGEDIEGYLQKEYPQEKYKPEITPGIYDVLGDEVIYNSYVLWRGIEGHLPSFYPIKIVQERRYDHKTRKYIEEAPALYYKKDVSYRWGWRVKKENKIKEYHLMDPSKQIRIPYFKPLSYQDYVKIIKEQSFSFEDFNLADSAKEILKANGEYEDLLKQLMSNQNLYNRKKFLNRILEKDPPKEIYNAILEVGSSEVISGLFLELAKARNPVLKEEAKQLVDSNIKWVEERFANGVKRCVKLYINSITPEIREKRIAEIQENLDQMDLHLISVYNREIPPDKIISGVAYRKYSLSWVYRDYSYDYGYDDYDDEDEDEDMEENDKNKKTKRFKPSLYSDGYQLNYIQFKNTIQEAEIYQLGNVLGKIAYYLDAPRLVYYFKGSGHSGALKYYKKYLRRIIDKLATQDESKFMEAMKNLLTSYTPDDYTCKFPGNFQFNKLLKHYIYANFEGAPPPSGYRYWSERYEWHSNDQLLKLKERCEFRPDIWDRHLDITAEIAINAKIEHVSKSCYYILKDSPNSADFIRDMEFKQLVQLSLVDYKHIAEMFSGKLQEKLSKLDKFDPEIMLVLMSSPSEELHNLANEFFNRTSGNFDPKTVVDLLFLENISRWSDLFNTNLMNMDGDLYSEFIKELLSELYKFLQENIEVPEEIKDILSFSTAKIRDVSKPKITELFDFVSDLLFKEPKIPDWLSQFIEEFIFSISYEDLESAVKEMKLDMARAQSSRNNRILSILKSVKFGRLPTNAEIIDILENGTSKMVNYLLILIAINQEELKNRFTTLLLMFESEVTALNFNASDVFNMLSSEAQKKLHLIVVDSPVERTYSYGLRKLDEIYKDKIPSDFIIHLLEHSANKVKAYISDKIDKVIDKLGNGNSELFMYYVNTLLYLPNKFSKSKDKVYKVLPQFAFQNKEKISEIESILLEIGGSNIIIDSERALVALAKIIKEVEYNGS